MEETEGGGAMLKILEQCGLAAIAEKFLENKVGVREVLSLTDEEFALIGVNAIGDRARLRMACRNTVHNNPPDSGVVHRLRELQRSRSRSNGSFSGRRPNNSRKTAQTTRRIYARWQHAKVTGGVYNMVPISKGGGKHDLDLEREATLSDVKKAFVDLFFPGGVAPNFDMTIQIKDLSYYIGKFNGEAIPEVLANGSQFIIDEYFKQVKVYPIRMYLYTSPNGDSGLDATSTASPLDASDDGISDPDEVATSNESQTDNNAHSTEDSGTPTVIFNRRVIAPLPDHSLDIELPDIQPRMRIPVLSTTSGVDDQTGTDILNKLKPVQETGKKNIINVARQCVILGGQRGFQRASFDPKQELSVKFSGEQGIDEGGPTREFLRLLMQEVCRLPIFTGSPHSRMLESDYTGLKAGTYFLAGKMMAYSLVHRGQIPNFLSPILYDAISKGIDNMEPTVNDILDDTYKEAVSRIEKCDDELSFHKYVEEADQLISMAGCYLLTMSINQKDRLVAALTHFVVLGRIKQCLDQ